MLQLKWRLGMACALLIMSLGSLQAAETFYKWVDEDGTTHYGTRPPNGVKSTAIKPKTGHSEPVNYKHSSSNSDTNPASTGQQEQPPESKKDPERCAAAKTNADILGRGGRVRETTDDGSFRFLDEEEKQKRLEAAQKAIDEAC